MDGSTPSTAENWIKFIKQFGPTASNTNLYDEKAVNNAQRSGLASINIPMEVDAVLPDLIRQEAAAGNSFVVFLTGTAGDGKTRAMRCLWNELQEGTEPSGRSAWDSRRPVQTLSLSNGYDIRFIKDLSAYSERQERGDFLRVESKKVVVVACNQGMLLKCLREINRPEELGLAEELESLFFSRKARWQREAEGTIPKIFLFDLSVYDAAETFKGLLREVYGHPAWQGCSQCDCAGMCPVLANRRALWNENECALTLPAERQAELIRLVTDNDVHLPIRDMLLLASNNLLGRALESGELRGKKNASLMDCAAVKASKTGRKLRSNVYENLVGRNLTPLMRRNLLPFRELDRFEVGESAPRSYDRLLENGPDGAASDVARRFYETLPEQVRKDFWLDILPAASRRKELLLLRRRVMFFLAPELDELDRWRLTAFTYGREYFECLANLRTQEKLKVGDNLIRGMNRIFTGQYLHDASNLLVTSSGASSGAVQGELLVCRLDAKARRRSCLSLEKSEKGGLRLRMSDGSEVQETFELTPESYEFFRRAADGYVIESFTKATRCLVAQYKARLMRSFSELDEPDDGQGVSLSIRSMDDDDLVDIDLRV